MTDKLQALPLWLRVCTILLLSVIATAPLAVPVIIIGIKYSDINTLDAMPLGYWLVLLSELLGFLILKFALRNVNWASVAPTTLASPGKIVRGQIALVFSIVIFGLMAVESNAGGHFNSLTLALVVGSLGIAIMTLPIFASNKTLQ